ncbi:MAG TPA: ABC transporter ATP-binding protein [Gemmatimonadales bacterium]|nr:ABC transporter ATP-binding protein [Gemmatimonadales bacterium]
MSSEPGIEFNHVWKKFHRGEMHDSLRDLVPAMMRRMMGRKEDRTALATGDFWALRDVCFQVKPGQTLGIIGSNGAGKSTVLKTLTRILRPTRGSCEVRGRMGTLIEIAAGFHPDLTGRENVFLQGAIMGMPAALIREKFDEIVEFSGIADFIDTPVKRYSSGMNARLGFAIAAYLDPDVLIIDEVLSVGDLAFQKKAFDRLSQLARSGRPVVVVSHQLDRMAQLCTDALLLRKGEVVVTGEPSDVIARYVMDQKFTAQGDAAACPVQIDAVDLIGPDPVRSGEVVRFRVSGVIRGRPESELEYVGLRLRALHNARMVFATSSTRCQVDFPESGPFAIDVELQMNVPVGDYVLETTVWDVQRELDASPGPKLVIKVVEGASFYGEVQCNPRMTLVSEMPTAVGHGP